MDQAFILTNSLLDEFLLSLAVVREDVLVVIHEFTIMKG